MHVPLPVLRFLTRRVVRPVLSPRLQPPAQRRIVDALARPGVLPKGTGVEASALGGVPSDRIVTPASDPHRALLWFHGGGYTVGSPVSHRAAVAHLAHHARAVGHLVDYRLAPENPHPAALEDAMTTYRALLATGTTPSRIVVGGDSAGGGLALALAMRARAEGLPLPAALALVSPWVDLTLEGLDESVDDPMLTRAWLERNARDYAGSTDRTDPALSPLGADLAGLPPLLVHGASDEVFIADIERLVTKAERAGVPVAFQRLEGHWHVTHLFAGLAREASEAVAQLGGWMRAALDDAAA